jgi:hypothetical protein
MTPRLLETIDVPRVSTLMLMRDLWWSHVEDTDEASFVSSWERVQTIDDEKEQLLRAATLVRWFGAEGFTPPQYAIDFLLSSIDTPMRRCAAVFAISVLHGYEISERTVMQTLSMASTSEAFELLVEYMNMKDARKHVIKWAGSAEALYKYAVIAMDSALFSEFFSSGEWVWRTAMSPKFVIEGCAGIGMSGAVTPEMIRRFLRQSGLLSGPEVDEYLVRIIETYGWQLS